MKLNFFINLQLDSKFSFLVIDFQNTTKFTKRIYIYLNCLLLMVYLYPIIVEMDEPCWPHDYRTYSTRPLGGFMTGQEFKVIGRCFSFVLIVKFFYVAFQFAIFLLLRCKIFLCSLKLPFLLGKFVRFRPTINFLCYHERYYKKNEPN